MAAGHDCEVFHTGVTLSLGGGASIAYRVYMYIPDIYCLVSYYRDTI